MDIESYVKKEAPDDMIGHENYARELRRAHESYKDLNIKSLKELQTWARERYRRDMGTHESAADCMIIYELLEEKKKVETGH